jgi:hypothetical protein
MKERYIGTDPRGSLGNCDLKKNRMLLPSKGFSDELFT